MKPVIIIAIVFVLLIPTTVFAQFNFEPLDEPIRHEKDIPDWFQYMAIWFMEDKITTHEFMTAIAYLVNEKIIKTEYASQMKQSDDVTYTETSLGSFETSYTNLYARGELDGNGFIDGIEYLIVQDQIFPSTQSSTESSPQESIISIQTDSSNYDEGDIVVVSGNVSEIIGNTPLTLQLFLDESLVDISQVTVAQDGTFSHTIIAEGSLWKQSGDYLIIASYGEGNIAETEFSFTPNSDIPEITAIFEVSLGSYSSFDVEYSIRGGNVQDMFIDRNDFSLTVVISSVSRGVISLDLPRGVIGAEKQDDRDDTFIVLIDGIEVAYQESVVHSDSRVITINFEEGDSDIKILGTYIV